MKEGKLMEENIRGEIKEIKEEIRGLENRVLLLEQRLVFEESVVNVESVENNVEMPYYNPEIPSEPFNYEMSGVENNVSMLPFNNKVKMKTSNQNLEQRIGKNIMGILASLLIFVGVASFVALVYKDMSDLFKIVLMYLFSFGLFGTGIFLMRRENNTFSKSLAACGIGTVFISLLLSRFYFVVLNDITLFVLMLAWSLFSYFLYYRLESGLFLIISYLGFALSLLLGSASSYIENPVVFAVLLVLQASYTLLINIMGKEREENKSIKCVNILSLLLSIIIASLGATGCNFMLCSFDLSTICLLIGVLFFVGVNVYSVLTKYNKSVFASFLVLLLCVSNIFSVLIVGNNIGKPKYYEMKPIGYSIMNIEIPKEEQKDNVEVINYAAEKLYLRDSYKYRKNYGNEHKYVDMNEIDRSDDIAKLSFVFGQILNLAFIIYLSFKNKSVFLSILKYLFAFVLGGSLIFIDYFFVVNRVLGLLPICIVLLYLGIKKNDNDLIIISISYYLVSLWQGFFIHTIAFAYGLIHLLVIYTVLQIAFVIVLNNLLSKKKSGLWDILLYVVNLCSLWLIVQPIANYIGCQIINKYTFDYYHLRTNVTGFWFAEEDAKSSLSLLSNNFVSLSLFIVNFAYLMFIRFGYYLCDKAKQGINQFRNDFLFVLNKIHNSILLLVGLGILYELETNVFLRCLLLIMTFVLCVIDFNKLVYTDKCWAGFYICIKFTIFMNLVFRAFLHNYEIDFIYSVISLLLAVGFIVFGFKKCNKSFRLSGLWLSIFAVLKLLLIDISYTNSLIRVVSLIFGGLICFSIVWIYNKMSEKIDNNSISNDVNNFNDYT